MNQPPDAIATMRRALDEATLVDDQPAYILGKLLDALNRGGWQIVKLAELRDKHYTEAADLLLAAVSDRPDDDPNTPGLLHGRHVLLAARAQQEQETAR